MIRDITLGQYYAKDSVVHRLDARVKIGWTFVYLIMLFLVDSFAGFGFTALCLAAAIAVSGVPFRFMIRGMKPVFVILLITFALNIFLYKGTVIWELGFLKITKEGLHQAVVVGLRLMMLIIGTSLLTYTTKPMALTDGFESILRPLSVIKVPSHEIAMMMSIALRFIPTLLEETDKIIKAQQSRGADFESGNIIQKVKALIPILIPLFVSAFRIAQDLAMAMEARCYKGGKGRTRLHPMKYETRDYAAYMLMLVYIAAILVIRYFL